MVSLIYFYQFNQKQKNLKILILYLVSFHLVDSNDSIAGLPLEKSLNFEKTKTQLKSILKTRPQKSQLEELNILKGNLQSFFSFFALKSHPLVISMNHLCFFTHLCLFGNHLLTSLTIYYTFFLKKKKSYFKFRWRY